MKNAIPVLIASSMAAIILLAATSAYSAWVSASAHHASCARSDLILDTLHDVVQIAFTPGPGQTLTAKQVIAIQNSETKIYARINEARC